MGGDFPKRYARSVPLSKGHYQTVVSERNKQISKGSDHARAHMSAPGSKNLHSTDGSDIKSYLELHIPVASLLCSRKKGLEVTLGITCRKEEET